MPNAPESAAAFTADDVRWLWAALGAAAHHDRAFDHGNPAGRAVAAIIRRVEDATAPDYRAAALAKLQGIATLPCGHSADVFLFVPPHGSACRVCMRNMGVQSPANP